MQDVGHPAVDHPVDGLGPQNQREVSLAEGGPQREDAELRPDVGPGDAVALAGGDRRSKCDRARGGDLLNSQIRSAVVAP